MARERAAKRAALAAAEVMKMSQQGPGVGSAMVSFLTAVVSTGSLLQAHVHSKACRATLPGVCLQHVTGWCFASRQGIVPHTLPPSHADLGSFILTCPFPGGVLAGHQCTACGYHICPCQVLRCHDRPQCKLSTLIWVMRTLGQGPAVQALAQITSDDTQDPVAMITMTQ